MLKKFALWFIYFGLSFFIESIGWTEQGKAFFIIYYLFAAVSVIIILVISCILAGEYMGERIGFSLVFVYLLVAIIDLFATWGATRLFNIDFFVAFQIMTFGQCLCAPQKKDD